MHWKMQMIAHSHVSLYCVHGTLQKADINTSNIISNISIYITEYCNVFLQLSNRGTIYHVNRNKKKMALPDVQQRGFLIDSVHVEVHHTNTEMFSPHCFLHSLSARDFWLIRTSVRSNSLSISKIGVKGKTLKKLRALQMKDASKEDTEA